MSSIGILSGGKLYTKINDEWVELAEVKEMEPTPEIEYDERAAKLLDTRPKTLTKKQARKALKYEKNPMTRKELQRIISTKD